MSTLFKRYLALEKDRPKDIQPVLFETLDALYSQTIDRLNVKAVEDPDWLDNVDVTSPAYRKAEYNINKMWQACTEGKATLGDFKAATQELEGVCCETALRICA